MYGTVGGVLIVLLGGEGGPNMHYTVALGICASLGCLRGRAWEERVPPCGTVALGRRSFVHGSMGGFMLAVH